MATASITDSQLRIAFSVGTDDEGNPVVKYKSFNNVKTSANADELFEVVNALAPLQQHPVSYVERNDSYSITAV